MCPTLLPRAPGRYKADRLANGALIPVASFICPSPPLSKLFPPFDRPESEESDLGWSAASSRRRATFGLDMIGHAEQVELVARILGDSDRGGWDGRDDLAAPSYKGDAAFEGPWSVTGGGRGDGPWGMPPTKEERGKEAAQRRKELETRLVLLKTYLEEVSSHMRQYSVSRVERRYRNPASSSRVLRCHR